ncbi:P-loop ATPase, Sll1717 family [Nocardiopsis dassonvillei]|uniref:P-loop ATPase, Sll1717 family n=1 Tax=Nocardiopsis dassonvillei TaxID=2014 RepID=UPI00157BD941|nr:hypothetical protein [Nocardiopsis dassonvillei]
MNKKEALDGFSLGARIAEEEAKELSSYFVETEQWKQVWEEKVDIVYGPKGSGKSAIYATLVERESLLFDKGILIAPAESPRGTPAFASLEKDPPGTEHEFINLWKLYFLTVVAGAFDDYEIDNSDARRVIQSLTDSGMLPGKGTSLRQKLLSVWTYVRRAFRPKEIEPTITTDPSGTTAISARIKFDEPDTDQRSKGQLHVDELFESADRALTQENVRLWLLLDRLDVAFAGQPDLENIALRSLFKVYLNLNSIQQISLKIFLRTDIWESITKEGFREASHITRELTLGWNEASLLHMSMQRILRNSGVIYYYKVNPKEVHSHSDREELFQRIYPEQVERGPNKPRTFNWCISRIQDGKRNATPRELIHLLSETRDIQIRRQELGESEPSGSQIFDGTSLKNALPAVSENRLTKTIYAEHPHLKEYIQKLEGQKSDHSIDSLSSIWEIPRDAAKEVAMQLAEIGFFEQRSTFWVPFLYRPALNLVQGRSIFPED